MLESGDSSGYAREAAPSADATGYRAVFPGILAGLTEEVCADLNPVEWSFGAEAIHGLRLDISRLRTALAALPAGLPKRQVKRLRHELKWLKRHLASAREWSVFVDGHGLLGNKPLGDSGMELIAVESHALQLKAVGRAALAVQSQRCIQLQASLAELSRELPAVAAGSGIPLSPEQRQSRELHAMAAAVLDELLVDLRKRARHLDGLKLAELHRMRIGVKHLRYVCELLRPLYGRRADPWLQALADLQKTLGSIQDGASAGQLTARLSKRLGARVRSASASIHIRHQSRLKHFRHKLRRQWAAFKDLEPFWTADSA